MFFQHKSIFDRQNFFPEKPSFWKKFSKEIFFGLLVGIFLGFFFLTSFGVSSDASALSANLSIPFGKDESGLAVSPTYDKVSEASIDNGAKATVVLFGYVFTFMKIFLGIFIIGWLVYAGFYMVAASKDEEKVTSGKKMVMYGVAGLALMLLTEPLILDILHGGRGVSAVGNSITENPQQSVINLRTQIDGILLFAKTLMVFVAMVYIMWAGAKMIFAFGDEEQIGDGKKMILPIFLGMLVILFNTVIIDEVLYRIFFDGKSVSFKANAENASNLMVQVVGFVQFLLEFVALIALGFFVYAGFLYVVAFGDEDKAGNAKKIMKNAAIGILVLLISYTLTYTLVSFSLG